MISPHFEDILVNNTVLISAFTSNMTFELLFETPIWLRFIIEIVIKLSTNATLFYSWTQLRTDGILLYKSRKKQTETALLVLHLYYYPAQNGRLLMTCSSAY
jgi:hypothetical protein